MDNAFIICKLLLDVALVLTGLFFIGTWSVISAIVILGVYVVVTFIVFKEAEQDELETQIQVYTLPDDSMFVGTHNQFLEFYSQWENNQKLIQKEQVNEDNSET